MEVAHHVILLGAGLIVLSIIAGLVSSRLGAPLLLVFLCLGILAGEDGPGGIEFDDFESTYLLGSIALAIILFDGGLRTSRQDFKKALGPSALLASVGVIVTAGVTGVAAKYLLDVSWIEGFLVGSIVASTDAAAVFFLLHLRGLRLRERVRSTLEVEAGLNDPMAIFLTILLVELLRAGAGQPIADMGETVLVRFALQFPASAVIGIAGGYGLLYIVNRLNIAAGLYPILAVSAALILFAGTQALGGSGFLVAYLAGFVFGSRRHRATQIIGRFHDGLAWLMQITMFLVLGLLVTPSAVLPMLAAAIGIAVVLMLVARPLAVLLCLLPFRYPPREVGFISWVGLRGAVPIYLGTIPVLSGIEESYKFFGVVYVVVIATLIVQGWTVAVAGRRLGMVLAPRPQVPARVDIDLPREVGRDMTAYTVHPTSLALRRPVARMPLPEQVDIVSVFRDGAIRAPGELTDLAPGDYVLLMAPTDRLPDLDRLFGAKWRQRKSEDPGIVDFEFPADTPTGAVADEYGFRVRAADRDLPLGAFLALCLREPPQAGQRLRRGVIELVAKEVSDGRIASVAIDLDPADWSWRRADPIRIFWRRFVWRPVARASKTLLRRLARHPAALARRIPRRRAT